jgi:PhoPQ-activated pathogenicity-related protein
MDDMALKIARALAFWLVLYTTQAFSSDAQKIAKRNPLEDYVLRSDSSYDWKLVEKTRGKGFLRLRLRLTSQKWQGATWQHQMLLVSPEQVRNPTLGFLLIAGDEPMESHLHLLEQIASAAGITTAVLSHVPNQPLFGGLVEDALIAHTFEKYVESKDATWPLLFPMVKSAVRAMDAAQAAAHAELGGEIEGFVVSGASKRGWTTWLAGAVDGRVKAMAPMVIDVLNLKAQMKWAAKVYGHPSEKIHDYTNKGLVERVDDPSLREMRDWIDPYSYRDRYRMPKLLLLGTNDPYWVVDSLRHYWNDLPEPKLIYQTPNGGHDLAGAEQADQTLAAFVQMIADGEQLPRFEWAIVRDENDSKLKLEAKVRPSTTKFSLWSAQSDRRDFREATWSREEVTGNSGGIVKVSREKPNHGFRAVLIEAQLETDRHLKYKISTEARVVPDE